MKRWMYLVVVASVAACGGEDANQLYGSLSEVYELGFDEVKLQQVGDFVVVEYVKKAGKGDQVGKVAKLTVNLKDATVTPGQQIDLLEQVDNGNRGTLTRVQQATTEFPIKRGFVTFDAKLTADKVVTGKFRTTLSEPDGRTLNGDFSAKLEEVSLQ